MAFFRTDGITWTTTAGVKTVVLTSAVGDLFVVIGAESGVTTTPTLTDDQTGGTYSLIVTALKNSSGDKMFCWVRNNLFTSAVSTTVTFTPSGDSGGGLNVMAIAGMSRYGAGAVRQSAAQENQASGTPTVTLATPVISYNMVIGAMFDGSNSSTNCAPPTGASWLERRDQGYNVPANGIETASTDSGETNSTITWGGAAASAYGALVIELDTSQILAPLLLGAKKYMRSMSR